MILFMSADFSCFCIIHTQVYKPDQTKKCQTNKVVPLPSQLPLWPKLPDFVQKPEMYLCAYVVWYRKRNQLSVTKVNKKS